MSRLSPVLLVFLVLQGAFEAVAAPAYTSLRLGFDDLEHTRDDGYNRSYVVPPFGRNQISEAGQILGYSDRFNGGSNDLGRSAWLYNGAATIRLGLTGAEHTRNDGYRIVDFNEMNEAGQVIGISLRYNGGSSDLGRSAWLYNGATTIDLSLTGTEYTRNDGYRSSFAFQINEAGQVLGSSGRYNGGSSDLGASLWLYDGATIKIIGLTGAEHTRNDGYKFSQVGGTFGIRVNEAGQVAGYSERFTGSSNFGRSAWLYNGATTINIGLTGAEHTASSGYKYSQVEQMNEAGQVLGWSARYNGGFGNNLFHLGFSAWLYDDATTKNIGLTDAEHTRNSDGVKVSVANGMNEAGQVVGYSERYNNGGGSSYLGESAWLYNGVTTIKIGLTGAEHTRNDGYKSSGASQINEAGQVIGGSARYNGGSSDLGHSAWLYNGATTIDLSLTGTEYTRNDGYKSSGASRINEAGQVLGSSSRYNGGSSDLGVSDWLYDGATIKIIGLTGVEHTASNGYRFTFGIRMNEAGQVVGRSQRFNGGSVFADLGYSTWFYNGAVTKTIGLTGADYTASNGFKSSDATQMNAAGQVVGSSQRFKGGSMFAELGSDAWFYDPSLDTTFRLQLSTRSDGYASSFLNYLGDDGLVLGSYMLFDEFDNELGYRPFYFTVADGLHDLGSLVEGGLLANGWDALSYYPSANSNRQIILDGVLAAQNGGSMPYLLNPVPEPGTVMLVSIGALAMSVTRWRKTAHAQQSAGRHR